jgi:hypothetical protein
MENTPTATHVTVPTDQQREEFIRTQLKPLRRTPEKIADLRYTGEWGTYNTDPTKSDWRIRQANRYLTELDRRRELWPITLGIWIGVATMLTAILAMPLKDSVLCRLFLWLGMSACG